MVWNLTVWKCSTRTAAVVCCKTSSESPELREIGDGACSLLRGGGAPFLTQCVNLGLNVISKKPKPNNQTLKKNPMRTANYTLIVLTGNIVIGAENWWRIWEILVLNVSRKNKIARNKFYLLMCHCIADPCWSFESCLRPEYSEETILLLI